MYAISFHLGLCFFIIFKNSYFFLKKNFKVSFQFLPMKKILFPLLLLTLSFCQEIAAPPEPVLPIPSERQIAWQELQFYGFVHFNMNTFSDREWGFGDEKPEQFNPTALDARQWARIAKEAGMQA